MTTRPHQLAVTIGLLYPIQGELDLGGHHEPFDRDAGPANPGEPDPETGKVFIIPFQVDDCWDATWIDEAGFYLSVKGTLDEVTEWALARPAAERYLTDGEDEFRLHPDGSMTRIT
ncbi:hypothetical protein GCM10027053_14130 [Intrasporangium mesophilum]